MKEDEVFHKAEQYLNAELALSDFYDWLASHELDWAALPESSPVRRIASRALLGIYEVSAGHRDESSFKEVVRASVDVHSSQSASHRSQG